MMKNLALGGVSLMFIASVAINIELHTDNVMLKAERFVYFETLKNYNIAYTELLKANIDLNLARKPQPPTNLRVLP